MYICIYVSLCQCRCFYIYIHICIYIHTYICKHGTCMYGGSRKVGTCPQEQIGPKPQVPTLISEAKVGTWSETRQRESWNLYCRERGTAITTTAPVLQRKRNYNCYDRSSIANSKKLQSLRPLHYCKERGNCNYHDRSNVAETETAITTTAPVLQRKKL